MPGGDGRLDGRPFLWPPIQHRPEPPRGGASRRRQQAVTKTRSSIDASASQREQHQRGFNDLPLGHSGPRWWPQNPAPPRMPRRHPLLIAAAARLATAREIVANQHTLIAQLRAAGRPTEDAEKSLQTYESSLRHLEEHERRNSVANARAMIQTDERDVRRADLRKPRGEFVEGFIEARAFVRLPGTTVRYRC
jgi:hypothetical protein